ncbi:condensin-2 complex subunit G2-like [Gigantopelta aegis]|uniref:condensin-2 complex subunit G2-like n=1 Tax=Gigantopelta aegis TaxID=1735272 RepID=UPI001B88D58C|nr:condensin-2 complex subunit G2-like [Gigantopelta aegis]
MTHRAELITLAIKEDLDGLLDFMKNRKLEDKDLFDTLASCSKRQLDDLWDGVQKMSLVTLLCMDANDKGESLEKCLTVLNAVLNLAVCTLDQDGHYIPSGMFEAVVLLHGILMSLPEDEDTLKNNMSKFFERWWSLNLKGREELAIQTLTYLLERSVKLDTVSASHLKRVWDMRDILTVIHLDDNSSDHLKELIQKCFRKSEYMKVPVGRRFLSFVFTLNTDFVENCHQTVKNILPFSPKSWWNKYGEIYFQAWQRTSGTLREKIEQHCIQDLMSHAIHAQRNGSKPMSSILLWVLGYIHKQKRLKGVDEMLLRLYGPILWRSLNVANPTVRANAVVLLCDVFPLTNPEANSVDDDALLQKQLDHLRTLLFDPSHTVRIVVIQGVCRIMSLYWELIPAMVIKAFITPLVQELAHDASSAEVRHAVFKSLTALMDNHLCHPMMKTILPRLGEHIFDISEMVRVAFMNLLLRVQNIRTIKLLAIVPIENLLSRLESDTPPVCRRIVKLLYSSYIVFSQPLDEQISRIIQMIEVNPCATRVFFLYAVKLMTLQETVNYMTTLCRFVLVVVMKANRNNHDVTFDEHGLPTLDDDGLPTLDEDQVDVRSDEDGDGEITMKDETILIKILDGLVIMWTSVSDELFKRQNCDLRRDLQKKMSIAVPQMLKAFQMPQAYTAIVMLAANVSAGQVPMLSSSFMSKLRKVDADASIDDYGVLLEAMCKWGKAAEVLEQISDWLKSEVTGSTASLPTASKKGKTMKKTVCFVDPINPKPKLAVNFLLYMLRNPICQQILLSTRKEELAEIRVILADVQKVIDGIVAGEDRPDAGVDPEFLEWAFSAYLSLLVLLNDANEDNSNSVTTLKELVMWADSALVPALTVKSEQSEGQRQKKKLYNTTLGMSMLAPDETLSETLLQPTKKLYSATSGMSLLMSQVEDGSNEKSESVTEMSMYAGAATRGQGQKRSTSDDRVGLAQIILTKLLKFCNSALLVGIGDMQLTNSLCNLCTGCLEADGNLEMLEKVIGCLCQVVEYRHANHYETHDDVDVSVPHCMGKVFNVMATYLKSHKSTYEQVFSDVRNVLSEMFTTVIQHRVTEGQIHKELMARTVATILAEHAHTSREDDLGEVKSGIAALPPLSSLILTILHSKVSSREAFVQEMSCFLKSAPFTDRHMVHGCVHLIHTLQKTKFCGAVLLECLDLLKPVLANLEMEEGDTDQPSDITRDEQLLKVGSCEQD